MALDRFFTGFEGGENTVFDNLTNCVFVDDGKARTGQYYLRANVPVASVNDGRAYLPAPTAGQVITGGYATAKARILFRLVSLPSVNYPVIFGFGIPGALQGTLRIKTNGKFAAAAITTIGADSTGTLAINTWYQAELTQIIYDPSGNIDCTIIISTEAGVPIESVTISSLAVMGATPSVSRPLVGHVDAINTTYLVDFDDWVSFIEDNGPATLPVGTRVTRVDASAVAESLPSFVTGAFWTGDFREITDIPFESVIADEMTSDDIDAQITFTHKSALELGISNCEAIRLYFQAKVNIAGVEWAVINFDTPETPFLGVAYTALPYTVSKYQLMTDTDFSNFVFGMKNRRAHLVSLGQMYCEVLHSGTNYWPATLVGTTAYKSKVIPYVGTGTFRDITTVGFKAQLVIIKKIDGVASSGAFKIDRMGGTSSKLNGAITKDPRAIRLIYEGGFSLGPSTHVNELGSSYVALCIEDGGYGVECKNFRSDSYIGNGVDDTDIVIKAGFTPQLIFISGADSIFRDIYNFAGDLSARLSANASAANLIQAGNADGFQIGSDALLNTKSVMYYYFAINDNAALSLFSFFDYDAKVAVGAATVFNTFLFQPEFIIAKREAAVAAQWRCSQSGLNSNLWPNVTSNTTGITAIAVNGFTVGATLSNAGDKIYGIIFRSGELNAAPAPVVTVGPDQTVAFGTRVTLPGGVTDDDYTCKVITSLWTIISQPAGAMITNWNVNDQTTLADFSKSGIYILRLTGSNGMNSAYDELTVTITCADIVVDAGPDQTILFKVGIVDLSGTVS